MGYLEDSIAPMPVGERMVELIRATENDLAEGLQPLGETFLVDNAVTLDEVYALADHLRFALIAYRKAPARIVAMAIGEDLAARAVAEHGGS